MADLYGLYDDASNRTSEARPVAVEQLRLMPAVALAAEWQGFIRDLYHDAVEAVTAAMSERETEPLARLLRVSLTRRRRVGRANADQSALSDDFGQLGLLGLWARLHKRTPNAQDLRGVLADVMAARNAVAHGSEPQPDALEARGIRVDVDTVHRWQVALDNLATALDALVAEHVGTPTGEQVR
jgi:hypothetical protein